jgi:hypothetical protein
VAVAEFDKQLQLHYAVLSKFRHLDAKTGSICSIKVHLAVIIVRQLCGSQYNKESDIELRSTARVFTRSKLSRFVGLSEIIIRSIRLFRMTPFLCYVPSIC